MTFFCVSAVVLHFLFTVVAALPGVVFCHRPGGRIAVEFAGPAGACLCDECEHCRKHLAGRASGGLRNGVVIDACRCAHEPFLNQVEGIAVKRDGGAASPAPNRTWLRPPAVFTVPDPARSTAESNIPLFALSVLTFQSGILRC